MRILSIGNSFSQDAHRYLRKTFEANGVPCKAVNLYIGGCTLRTHYLNMLDDEQRYFFEFGGESTGLSVSIREAVRSDDWDIITLQQQSSNSCRYETFQPYLDELADYVHTYCPHAKLYMHQTWAYEQDSTMLHNAGYETERNMFNAIRVSYLEAAKAIDAVGIIPAGEAMLYAHTHGIEKVHRDCFHASLVAGRALLSLTWYAKLTGKDVADAVIPALDGPITDAEIRAIKEAVKHALEV